MKTSTTHILIVVGIIIGAGIAMAVTFNPGDAGKVSDGVTFQAPNDNVQVKLWGETNVTMDDVFPNSTTHSSQFADRSVMLNTTEGNITIASDGPTTAHVHKDEIVGSYTNITNISAGGTWIEVYPQNKDRVDVRGDTTDLSITNMTVDDGNVDFYINGTDGGTGTVKLYNLSATNANIVALDAQTNTFLAAGSSDANGNVTLDIGLSSHNVLLQTNANTVSPTHENATPTGEVTAQPNNLSVDMKDGDFPQDEVETRIWLDGTRIHVEENTQNATVKTSNFSSLDLGTHRWNVTSVDAYGNTQTDNYTFNVPENITIRNESNQSQIITGKNITATFYSESGDVVIRRTDNNDDGNISLAGLPDVPFVVTFSGDGFYDRRAYIESIFNQKNIYLLNSTAYPTADDSAIETTFVYEDRTGNFPQSETTLRIQRAVDPNNDSNFSYENVAGDFWGAAGEFPFTGQYQERYRLVIKNQETGDERIIGTHIPTEDGVKNIIVGNIIFDAENATGRYWDAEINQNTSNLQAYYNDPANETDSLRVRVYERGNQSNEIFDQNYSDLGEKVITISLTQDQLEDNWVVEFDGEDTDGNSIYGKITVGSNVFALPIDPQILYTLGLVMVVFIGSLYGPRTALMGAWGMIIVAMGLMLFGWVNIPVVGITMAVLIATGGMVYREAVPR